MNPIDISALFQDVMASLLLLHRAATLCSDASKPAQQLATAMGALNKLSEEDVALLPWPVQAHFLAPTRRKGIQVGRQKWRILSLLDNPTREPGFVALKDIALSLKMSEKSARDQLGHLKKDGFVARRRSKSGKLLFNITQLGREELLYLAAKNLFSKPKKCAAPQAEKTTTTTFVLPEGFTFNRTLKNKLIFDRGQYVGAETAKADILTLLEYAKRQVTGTDCALSVTEMRKLLPQHARSLSCFITQLHQETYNGAPVVERGKKRGYWRITDAGSAALKAAGLSPDPV